MPQGPIAVATLNATAQGARTTSNITVPTVIKAARGTLLGIQVIVDGSAPGTANNCAATADAAAGNEVSAIPNAIGAVSLPNSGIPCVDGIVVVPGTGQTIAVSFV